MSMSLDDIIKKNQDKVKGKRKPRPEKKESAKGMRGVPVGRKAKVATPAAAQKSKTDRLVKVVSKGGVAKGRRPVKVIEAVRPAPQKRNGVPPPRPGGGFARRGNDFRQAEAPGARRAALEGDGKWKHDLFQEVAAGGGVRRGNVQSRLGDAPGASGAKLFISNLDFKVTDQDVRELFEVYGRLRRVVVHYDHSGRSEGTAEVIFEKVQDAGRAQERYNKVALDGKPMKIDLMPLDAPSRSGVIKTLSSGIRLTESAGGGGRSGLQITRNFAQAANGTVRGSAQHGGSGGDRQRSQPRIASRVVRGRGTVTSDFMQE